MTQSFQGCAEGVAFRVGYGWNEPTRQACAIADIAMSAGVPVTFASTGEDAKANRVHEVYDDCVVHTSLSKPRWLKTTFSDVVWFDVRREEARIARRAGLRSTLVLLHSSWINGLLSSADLYDRVVVASPDDRVALSKYVETFVIPTMCESHLPLEFPENASNNSLWLIDGDTLRRHGSSFLHTLDILFGRNARLRVKLLCQGTWDNVTGRALTQMQRKYPDRFEAHKKVSHYARRSHYAASGSIVCLSCVSLTGLSLLEALRAGRPLAAFSFGRTGEILANCPRVKQLPCLRQENGHGCPEAEPLFAPVLEALTDYYSELEQSYPESYDSQVDAYLDARRHLFVSSWQKLWYLQ